MPSVRQFLGVAARWLLPAFALLLPFAGCQCVDRVESQRWKFQGPETFSDIPVDAEAPEDTSEDVYVPPDIGDISVAEDTWQPEDVVADVHCENALNDRTSLIVDRRGTTWVGFHKFRSDNCDQRPTLVVARKPLGGDWTEEDIQPHEGIFGVSSINPGSPITVYPDPIDGGTGRFRAAHRQSQRDWDFHNFNVGGDAVHDRDGFDVTEDGESFWTTFARENGEMVRLFEYDTTAANPEWKGRAPLNIPDPQPAIARGLRADTEDSVYLVHRNPNEGGGPGSGLYGIARYDKETDDWPDREYLDDVSPSTTVHSLTVRQNGELCMSNHDSGHLLVTCGTMSDLDGDHEYFDEARIENIPPTSITEGDDGTLYVAYHPPSQNELRLAKREPGESWSTQQIYDNPASAVSTAIDLSGHLVLAFYTRTDSGRYSLKVLRERPDQL